jgi:poly(3-hydroxybutyrate) depolymerase
MNRKRRISVIAASICSLSMVISGCGGSNGSRSSSSGAIAESSSYSSSESGSTETTSGLDNTLLSDLRVTIDGKDENLLKDPENLHTLKSYKQADDQTWLVAEIPVGTEKADVFTTAKNSGASIQVDEQQPDADGKTVIDLNPGGKTIDIKVNDPNSSSEETYQLQIRTEIDPDNPYQTLFAGEHTESVTLDSGEKRTFTSYVPNGARESTAGIFVLPDKDKDVIDRWKALADQTDTEAIDGEWTKQQEKFIVIYLDGLSYDGSDDDVDYVNKVFQAASGRTMYCIHEAKNYLVGYGAGGAVAQKAAMDQTSVWAGLTTIGAETVDPSWISAKGEETASSLDGFNDQQSSTRPSQILKKTLPLPVWMINDGTETDEAVLNYWKSADKIDGKPTEEDGISKYVRTQDWQKNNLEDETLYQDNRDKDAYRIWVSDKPEGDLESIVWNQFLYGVRRWMADPGGDLRITLDPISDQHMTRNYKKVGDWMREWYVYVPEDVTKDTKDVPLVFAFHGYTLNGAVYSGQTDWPKIADQNHCIVIFPSAIPLTLATNAPFPAWNLSGDPTRMDDIAFTNTMLEDISSTYDIDMTRIYATGHSYGSQMTYLVGLNEPEKFAAIAPLSGYMFNSSISAQAENAMDSDFTELPVYVASGTEGDTEWSICPVPPKEDNLSGQTLVSLISLNQCDGTIDWSKVGADWRESDAYTQDGRWYTLTYNKGDVPMVRVEIVDYMPHATMPEHTARVWRDWFSHFSRNEDGTIQYS